MEKGEIMAKQGWMGFTPDGVSAWDALMEMGVAAEQFALWPFVGYDDYGFEVRIPPRDECPVCGGENPTCSVHAAEEESNAPISSSWLGILSFRFS